MFNLFCFFIVCFGAINWFCIGIFQFDLVAGIFGSQAVFVSRFIYTLIGLASIYLLIALPIKKEKLLLDPAAKEAKKLAKTKQKEFEKREKEFKEEQERAFEAQTEEVVLESNLNAQELASAQGEQVTD